MDHLEDISRLIFKASESEPIRRIRKLGRIVSAISNDDLHCFHKYLRDILDTQASNLTLSVHYNISVREFRIMSRSFSITLALCMTSGDSNLVYHAADISFDVFSYLARYINYRVLRGLELHIDPQHIIRLLNI